VPARLEQAKARMAPGRPPEREKLLRRAMPPVAGHRHVRSATTPGAFRPGSAKKERRHRIHAAHSGVEARGAERRLHRLRLLDDHYNLPAVLHPGRCQRLCIVCEDSPPVYHRAVRRAERLFYLGTKLTHGGRRSTKFHRVLGLVRGLNRELHRSDRCRNQGGELSLSLWFVAQFKSTWTNAFELRLGPGGGQGWQEEAAESRRTHLGVHLLPRG
jgi:hypothetical protein